MASEFARIEGLEGVMRTLEELPPEIVSRRGGPVRSALRKASKLLVEESRAQIDQITAQHGDDSTGLLRQNVVTVRDSRMSGGERYFVRIRRKQYPQDHAGKPVNTRQVGAMLEHGTEKRPPMPWMRRAFELRKHQAAQFFAQEINAQLGRIVRRLARRNGVA